MSHAGCDRELGSVRLTHVFQLSRLQAEIDSLRDLDPQQPYRNTSNPLPPPPEPLPLDRFPAFARPGGAADTSDPLLSAVPYPPPPRAQPNGYPPVTAYSGTAHTQYVPPALISQPVAVPRARHAETPRVDERNRRPATTQEVNGVNHPKEERRPHAESSRMGAAEAGFAKTDGRSQIDTGPVQARRVVVPPSPAPSWAHHPLVEGRSDEEREARSRTRTNGTNGIMNGGSEVDPRTVAARLASAEAYVQGYGSGYDSGFQISREPSTFAPSSRGSDRSDRVHGFPVQESPDQPIGLGLMGVPQPIAGTVSTPDEDATPMNRARRLTRRNTTQAVDGERSARRLGDQPLLDVPQNGGARRAPVPSIDQVLGVRRTVTEGTVRRVVNGVDDPGHRRTVSGVAVPLAGENESPRSETTWGTVQTLSRNSMSGGSISSLGLLVGLHNGGVRGQGSVESYIGRRDLGDNVTSAGGEDDEMETPTITGGLSGLESDVSSLGLIREDEGEYQGSRNGRAMESMPPVRRATSYSERNPQASETTQSRQLHRARRSDGTNDHRRHASPSTIAELLRPVDSGRAVNASNITGTNALSLHFDASFPTHDHQDHPSGLEIVAPTPIVGGPNIIHLWANRA